MFKRVRHGNPVLVKGRERTIVRLLERNPELFESEYHRLRHKFMATFARLMLDLAKCNIEVTQAARIERKTRKRTGHQQMYIKGIKITGPVKWEEAKKIIKATGDNLLALRLQLDFFLQVAKNFSFALH